MLNCENENERLHQRDPGRELRGAREREKQRGGKSKRANLHLAGCEMRAEPAATEREALKI